MLTSCTRGVFVVVCALALCACVDQAAPASAPDEIGKSAAEAEVRKIQAVMDAWHLAAAEADEEAYFGHFTDEAVFLGTDETERWDVDAFRKYAHPHFAKGKAWSFKAARRDVILSRDGRTAWFDEDLVTPNLGPARGSGVLLRQGDHWRIAHYNLTITVPNERFKEVKTLLENDKGETGVTGDVHGVVSFFDKPPKMTVPKTRPESMCKPKDQPHDGVRVTDGRLADVMVRIQPGALQGTWQAAEPLEISLIRCSYRPRMVGLQLGQELHIANRDQHLHNINGRRGYTTLFNVAQPKGAPELKRTFDEPGVYRLGSDLFSFMYGFVVVTDHPFFTVTGSDGTFRLKNVPTGKHVLEAFHAIYGWKRLAIVVSKDKSEPVTLAYSGTEPPPEENAHELQNVLGK